MRKRRGRLSLVGLVVWGFIGLASPLAGAADDPATAVSEARELLAESRRPEAIAVLQEALSRQPDDPEARGLLARLLAWEGALVAAVDEAERGLAIAPGHPEALRALADASAWRGDFATALPSYRRYLALEPSPSSRLAYANALVSAGYLGRAEASAEALEPGVAGRDALRRRLDRARAPALLVGVSRYRDSDDAHRAEHRAEVSLAAGDARLNALFERVDAEGRMRDSEARRLLLGGERRVADALAGRLALGVTEVSDRDSDRYAVGRLDGWGRRGDLGYRLRLEHDVFDETATLLANRIRRTELEIASDYAVSGRWHLAGQVTRAEYSDDNAATELEFTPQFVLRQGDPGVRLGYRRTDLRFERQSGGGYFDPDRLTADRLMLFATLYRPRVRGDLELFVGEQRFTRGGDEPPSQFIAGGSARLDVDLGRRLTLRSEVEGGNFDLNTPDGFSYWLATLNLVVRL